MSAPAQAVTREQIEERARDLLDALDRMHGRAGLSQNVLIARDELRRLLPRELDPRDESVRASWCARSRSRTCC